MESAPGQWEAVAAPSAWADNDRTVARPTVSRDGAPPPVQQQAWPAAGAHPAAPAPAPVAAEPEDWPSTPNAGWSSGSDAGWPAAPAPLPPVFPAPPSAPPASVRRLKNLAYVGAAVGLVSIITSLAMGSRISISAIAGIAGIIAYVYLSFQVVARKDWARIVIGIFAILGVLADLATVVSLLGVLAFLQGIGGGEYVAAIVFGGVLAVVSAVVLVWLAVSAFHRDTAAWCRPMQGGEGR